MCILVLLCARCCFCFCFCRVFFCLFASVLKKMKSVFGWRCVQLARNRIKIQYCRKYIWHFAFGLSFLSLHLLVLSHYIRHPQRVGGIVLVEKQVKRIKYFIFVWLTWCGQNSFSLSFVFALLSHKPLFS